MLTFKNFNIADWFSFYRIFAAPILIITIFLGERELFTWLLLISYDTDAIDGFIARKLKITSPRGSQLDSIGDQLTLFTGFIGLLMFEFDFIKFVVASIIGRGARFFVVGGLIYHFGPKIKLLIEKYFDLFAIVCMVLLIGGFILLKYLK